MSPIMLHYPFNICRYQRSPGQRRRTGCRGRHVQARVHRWRCVQFIDQFKDGASYSSEISSQMALLIVQRLLHRWRCHVDSTHDRHVSKADPDGIFVQLGSGWNIFPARIRMEYLSSSDLDGIFVYSSNPDRLFVQLGSRRNIRPARIRIEYIFVQLGSGRNICLVRIWEQNVSSYLNLQTLKTLTIIF